MYTLPRYRLIHRLRYRLLRYWLLRNRLGYRLLAGHNRRRGWGLG